MRQQIEIVKFDNCPKGFESDFTQLTFFSNRNFHQTVQELWKQPMLVESSTIARTETGLKFKF